MGKGAVWSHDLLRLYFLGQPIASVADNAAASPCTNHVLALHVADPGSGGSQDSYETTYTGYARQLVPRGSAGWVVVGNQAKLAVPIAFPVCSAAPGDPIRYWSISRGGGVIDYVGPVVPAIVMATVVQPVLTDDSVATEL